MKTKASTPKSKPTITIEIDTEETEISEVIYTEEMSGCLVRIRIAEISPLSK